MELDPQKMQMPPMNGKRPRGMTFLLILSLINACWKILSSLVSYFIIPATAKMMESGELEDTYAPLFSMMKWGEDEIDAFMSNLQAALSINVNYHLIVGLLFIGSLVGVILMFRPDKRGLHVYSISQICILIAASVYLYPKQAESAFVYDLFLTLMFIFMYYLFFKRIELANFIQDHNSDSNSSSDSDTTPEP